MQQRGRFTVNRQRIFLYNIDEADDVNRIELKDGKVAFSDLKANKWNNNIESFYFSP